MNLLILTLPGSINIVCREDNIVLFFILLYFYHLIDLFYYLFFLLQLQTPIVSKKNKEKNKPKEKRFSLLISSWSTDSPVKSATVCCSLIPCVKKRGITSNGCKKGETSSLNCLEIIKKILRNYKLKKKSVSIITDLTTNQKYKKNKNNLSSFLKKRMKSIKNFFSTINSHNIRIIRRSVDQPRRWSSDTLGS